MNNNDINVWFDDHGLSSEVQSQFIPPSGHWQLNVGEFPVRIQTQESANRMRIVAYITGAEGISIAEYQIMMEANSHSALDARYAIDNGYIVSLFLHPFKELDLVQFVLGFYQVISCAETYGKDYTGGTLFYGASQETGNASAMEQGADSFLESLTSKIRNIRNN
ncbi:hypothetical protein [Gimesia aquarii]|uniref:Uncharacterized protein n=1 Tax=Gimesia aquarii TaxID=2527964 RepID=A0A517VV12_9PLAN|nr:hypothetical protein [Gimesia aquarii]QDT96840.1 hypothetical protein V144x_22980 [Gimesia aquarii]